MLKRAQVAFFYRDQDGREQYVAEGTVMSDDDLRVEGREHMFADIPRDASDRALVTARAAEFDAGKVYARGSLLFETDTGVKKRADGRTPYGSLPNNPSLPGFSPALVSEFLA